MATYVGKVEQLIIDSARKHSVADDDMLHANHFPIRYKDLDDGFTMLIGTARSAQLLEVCVVDHGPVIVHAMTARRKYLR